MDLTLSPGDIAFRHEVRAFFQTHLPPELQARVRSGTVLGKAERVAWYRHLDAQGWMAPGWPAEYGGAAWTPMQRMIFDEEVTAAGAPPVIAQGVSMLGPILIAFGNEAQKAHYLPRILHSDDWWCQGYSEPESGSDLASLQARAERHGDVYRISGQKIWITQADIADMMFALVRTQTTERKYDGITFVLIDMRSPGITVRPIETLNNEAEICEVFLDDVAVPVENRVGAEGDGWKLAMHLLEHERSGVGGVARARALIESIRARQLTPSAAERIARLEIRLMATAFTQLRAVSAVERGGRPGRESSLLKIIGTELLQEISYADMLSAGPAALEKGARSTSRYLDSRKLSIFSGSNEIQRNIIAKRILGL